MIELFARIVTNTKKEKKNNNNTGTEHQKSYEDFQYKILKNNNNNNKRSVLVRSSGCGKAKLMNSILDEKYPNDSYMKTISLDQYPNKYTCFSDETFAFENYHSKEL